MPEYKFELENFPLLPRVLLVEVACEEQSSSQIVGWNALPFFSVSNSEAGFIRCHKQYCQKIRSFALIAFRDFNGSNCVDFLSQNRLAPDVVLEVKRANLQEAIDRTKISEECAKNHLDVSVCLQHLCAKIACLDCDRLLRLNFFHTRKLNLWAKEAYQETLNALNLRRRSLFDSLALSCHDENV